MECHKVERVTGASEDGKSEWSVEVTEECLMLPTKPARTAKPYALNFGGYLDFTQFSDNHHHRLGEVLLVPGCRTEELNTSPNKFKSGLEKPHPRAEGDIVALTNEPE